MSADGATNQPTTPRCDRAFYRRQVIEVAKSLLGQRLVRVLEGERLAVTIVEVEAYLGIPDAAAHTYEGRRTPRNESMWRDGGALYVYFTYGMHHCMNVVAQREGEPVAALLRAGEPVEGIETMRRRRPKARRDVDLCSGPAKLTQALAIDRDLNGVDLTRHDGIFIERVRSRRLPARRIATGPRVGIGYAGEWVDRPLRFAIRDHAHVSRPPPW